MDDIFTLTILMITMLVIGAVLLGGIMLDSMDVPVTVKGLTWGISIAGTLVLSFLISRIVSRKIPGIDMVEALKAKK